jgi:hypothetical protein
MTTEQRRQYAIELLGKARSMLPTQINETDAEFAVIDTVPMGIGGGGEVDESSIHSEAAIYCAWGCGRRLRNRRGGSPARFCSPGCRAAFWTACRRWGERAVAAGTISIDDLRRVDTAACTLRGEGDSCHEDDFLAGVRKRSPPG